MNREQVLATVAKRGIRFIRLLFCDIVGFPKCVTITSDELEESLDSGKGFDGWIAQDRLWGVYPNEDID